MITQLLLLFILAIVFNTIPAISPPTSFLLSYFYISTNGNLILLTLITVFGAMIGRIVLYNIVKYLGAKFLAERVQHGYGILRKIVHKNNFYTIVSMTLYCISPASTSVVFIVAGTAQIRIWPLLIGFFVGRTIQYLFVAATVSTVLTSLQDVIGQGLFNPYSIAFAVFGIIGAIIFIFIDWEKLINERKIRFYKKVLK